MSTTNIFTAIVLAGGKGTRLSGLFPNLPKPMVPVCGKPFLHWLIVWVKEQGISDFVFSVGHHAGKIEDWLRETPLFESGGAQIYRENLPLGTGGGVRACLDLCAENILVTNGDSLIVTPIQDLLKTFLEDPSLDGMIVGKSLSDTMRYASLDVDKSGLLAGYREKVPGHGLISAGVYLFRKRLLESFPLGVPLSMEYELVPKLLADGARIGVYRAPDQAPFIDIGTPETVALADAFVKNNLLGDDDDI